MCAAGETEAGAVCAGGGAPSRGRGGGDPWGPGAQGVEGVRGEGMEVRKLGPTELGVPRGSWRSFPWPLHILPLIPPRQSKKQQMPKEPDQTPNAGSTGGEAVLTGCRAHFPAVPAWSPGVASSLVPAPERARLTRDFVLLQDGWHRKPNVLIWPFVSGCLCCLVTVPRMDLSIVATCLFRLKRRRTQVFQCIFFV